MEAAQQSGRRVAFAGDARVARCRDVGLLDGERVEGELSTAWARTGVSACDAVVASGLPASVRVEVIPGKGHMVMLEAAGEVNRLLNAFWS